MHFFRKNPKHLANQETLDIEESIRRLIQRLLETSIQEGHTPEEISSRLTGMVRTLSSSQPEAAKEVGMPGPKPQGRSSRIVLASTNPDFSGPSLSLALLDQQVIPYLGALEELQKVLDEIARQENLPLLISSIRFTPQLTLEVEHIKGILDLLQGSLETWRTAYTEISKARLSPNQPVPDSGLASQSPRQLIQSIKTKFAMELVERFMPSLSTTDKVTYSIRMQPMIEMLLVSALELK